MQITFTTRDAKTRTEAVSVAKWRKRHKTFVHLSDVRQANKLAMWLGERTDQPLKITEGRRSTDAILRKFTYTSIHPGNITNLVLELS